jgi:hypothetical protein
LLYRWSELPADIALIIFKQLEPETVQLHLPVTYPAIADTEPDFASSVVHNLRATCKQWKKVIDSVTRRIVLSRQEETALNPSNFPLLEVLDTSRAEMVHLVTAAKNDPTEALGLHGLSSNPALGVRIRKKKLRPTYFREQKNVPAYIYQALDSDFQGQRRHVIPHPPHLLRVTDLTIALGHISQINLIKVCPWLRSLHVENHGSKASLQTVNGPTLKSRNRSLAIMLSPGLACLTSISFHSVDIHLVRLDVIS